VVKPWIEIARMPPYVRASAAERMAIRDLYWRICVEEKIPFEQRTMAYSDFVHDWANRESGTAQRLREQQARVPSPVDAATMGRWCQR
jgi:serine/threonine-protein kinase RIO1